MLDCIYIVYAIVKHLWEGESFRSCSRTPLNFPAIWPILTMQTRLSARVLPCVHRLAER